MNIPGENWKSEEVEQGFLATGLPSKETACCCVKGQGWNSKS